MPRGKKGSVVAEAPVPETLSPEPALVPESAAPAVPVISGTGQQLQLVNGEIAQLEAQGQQLIRKVNTYAETVSLAVKTILTEVGVWDEVHAMEVERQDVNQRAQVKLQALQQQLSEKVKLRDALAAALATSPETPPPRRQWARPVPPEI